MGYENVLTFRSRRSPVLGTSAAVATSQPLATDIGARILRCGGNAVDASIAISAALSVLEPCSTGLGGDCFLLYYEASTRKVHGLNGSGMAPAALTLERCLSDLPWASEEIPAEHPHSVTVPGAAAGWCDALSRWGSGSLSLSEILEPAALLAQNGFPVSPVTAFHWKLCAPQLEAGPHGAALLMPNGKPPQAGEVFRNHDMARVLRELGAGGKEAFYEGSIGSAIVDVVRELGGVLSMEDLKAHETSFVDPISVEIDGVRVHEVPPNGQGITVLLALNILKELGVVGEGEKTGAGAGAANVELPTDREKAAYWHRLIEALRLAFADTRWYCADPDKVYVPVEELLGRNYAAERARLIDPAKASVDVVKGSPTKSSCTVSFQVVDEAGNAVSFVNSNYLGFGSGIIPKGCGFTLQSRGSNFALDPEHPNVLAPGKRPYHTIIPCMVTTADTGELFATMTNMGGFMQAQGHVQLLMNLLFRGMDPQAAIDAPRFCIFDGKANGKIGVEPWTSEDEGTEATAVTDRGEDGQRAGVVNVLRRMGHSVVVRGGHDRAEMGRAQIIQRKVVDGATQVLWCGSDGRADGCAMAW
ncbi:unnamed protein product [Ascophyllum nodosum]